MTIIIIISSLFRLLLLLLHYYDFFFVLPGSLWISSSHPNAIHMQCYSCFSFSYWQFQQTQPTTILFRFFFLQ